MTHRAAMQPGLVTGAICAVASSISGMEAQRRRQAETESRVWQLLAACIFGSATRYEDAVRAVEALIAAGIGDPSGHSKCLADCVQTAMVHDRGAGMRVRFGRTRSRQLVESYEAIRHEWGGLIAMLASERPAKELRTWLVDHCPGLGAKQASLFLRDAGYTDDLAVIDTHVAWYMALAGIGTGVVPRSKREYEAAEERLGRHAAQLGMTLALFDKATWVVGRVMRQWK